MKHKQYPRRDAIKNYFPLPNEVFTLKLSTGEFAVYSYLLYRENRKTYQCFPSYRTIGSAFNVSQNTVRKYVSGLEGKGLITAEPTTVRTKDGRVRNGSLRYTIRPIQEALELCYARKMQKAEEAAQRQRAEQQMAKLARVGPCEPLCAALEGEANPRHSKGVLDEIEPFSDENTRTKEKAGESAGVASAPTRRQPPAVRAVSGRRAGRSQRRENSA